MMELVDDDDVEVIGSQICHACGPQALDRGEDVLKSARTMSADPELSDWVPLPETQEEADDPMAAGGS